MIKKHVFLYIWASICTFSMCFANSCFWTNGGNGVNWSDGNNWDCGSGPGTGPPGFFDDVDYNTHFGPCPSNNTIDVTDVNSVHDGGCNSIAFTMGTNLTLTGDFNLATGGGDTMDTTVSGYNINPANLLFDGAWTVNGSNFAIGQSLTVGGGATASGNGNSVMEFTGGGTIQSASIVFDNIQIDPSAVIFETDTTQATNIVINGVLELQGNACVGNTSLTNNGSLYAYGNEFIFPLINNPGSTVFLTGSGGSYSFFGSLTYDSVQITGNGNFATTGDIVVNSFFYNGAATTTFQNNITFNGDTFENRGTILSTPLSNSTFTWNGGTLFDLSASSTTFWNFYYLPKTGGTPTLEWISGTTMTVQGVFQSTTTGVTFLPGNNGIQWFLNDKGTNNVKNVNTRDSNASLGNTINCLTGCTDTGNNVNWVFATAATGSPFASFNGGGLGKIQMNSGGLGRIRIN